jgi:hypothetical protein
MTVSIEGEGDIANVRNVARLSAQVLSFSVTDQARVGWAVANIARLMLTLGYRDAMSIAHLRQGSRRGIQITCNGKWLRLVRASWLEQKTLSDVSQWVDEVDFTDGEAPSLTMIVWAPENGAKRSNEHARTAG